MPTLVAGLIGVSAYDHTRKTAVPVSGSAVSIGSAVITVQQPCPPEPAPTPEPTPAPLPPAPVPCPCPDPSPAPTPTPVPVPVPPTPDPTPPPPVPVTSPKVARVLILTDLYHAKPTKEQQATLAGSKLWTKLETVCPQEAISQQSGTNAAYRYWDVSTDASAESQEWQEAFAHAKSLISDRKIAYPAIVILTDGLSVVAPVPATDADVLKLFDGLTPGA